LSNLLNEVSSLFWYFEVLCDIVIKSSRSLAISSPDEFLLVSVTVDYCEQRSVSLSKYVRCVSG